MSLVHYEVAYHLTDNPSKTHVIRLLTSEDPTTVDEYLIHKYGASKVVLHYAELEPKPRSKNFFGFKTGDMVKVVVPLGSKTNVPVGTHTGRVAVRSSGSFDVKTRDAKLGIYHKYCQQIHLMDGYSYA